MEKVKFHQQVSTNGNTIKYLMEVTMYIETVDIAKIIMFPKMVF